MIWGMTLHPGVEYCREVTKEEHLTLASLDCRPKMTQGIYHPMAHLVVKVNNCEHVLCYLEKGISHQQSLDFIFQEGDSLALSVEGTSVMHISGYTVKRSMHEGVQHDGSVIPPVKAELDETHDDIDSTTSLEDPLETFDESFTSAERRQHDVVSLQQSVKMEKDDDEDYCEILQDPIVCEDSEAVTPSLQISAEDIDQLQKANRTEIDFSNQDLQKTLRVVLANAKGEKFHATYGRREIECKIAEDAKRSKTDSNSILQEHRLQDKCGSSDGHSQRPSLERQIKEEPDQGEGDQNLFQDVDCEDIIDALLRENSERVDFLSRKSADTSQLQTPNEMEVRLDDANFQETSVHVVADSEKEKKDSNNNLELKETFVDPSARVCSNTHDQESNQGIEMSGADIDDTSHGGLCSDNDEEESQPHSTESDVNLSGDELPAIDIFHHETSAGANEDDNSCQTSVGRLPKPSVKSPETGKNLDFLLRSLKSHGVRTTQHPQQSKTTESAASESNITEGEETSISRSQHKCTVCEKTFRRRVSLMHHSKTHMVPEMQQCQSCNRFFSAEEALYEGNTTSHGYFQCQLCETKSVNQSEKPQHPRSGLSGQVFKCHLCKMSFPSKRCLIIHKIKHNAKNEYLCQFCGKVFPRKQNLQVHERIHNSSRPFKCQFCGKMFVQKIQMKVHERKYHIDEKPLDSQSKPPKHVKKHVTKHARIRSGKRPFKCQFCSKRFLTQTHALEHERIHTGEKPFKCQFCDRGFAAKGNANKHERTVHCGENPFICLHCGERFNEKSQLTQHGKIHTEDREFESSFDNPASQDDNGRITHETILTNEKPFKCSFCDKTYFTKSHLSKHEKTHTGKRSFKCQFCGKGFLIRQHVLRHEKIHTGERPFKCRFCAKGFIEKHIAERHELIHTRERPFKCQFCEKGFFTKGGALKHEVTHAGKNSFKCQFCPKRCNVKSSLKRHEKTHTERFFTKGGALKHVITPAGENSLKCQFCPKRFSVRSSLKRHERTHTDEKKFKCSFCNQGFRRNSYRIIHERSHTNERPYKCSFCPKRFIQQTHVICHERIHTREKPFECLFCVERFSQKSALTYHEGTHAKQMAIQAKT